MLKILNKAGIASIVEVIVTSVIFMIAVGGIFSSVTTLRPDGIQSTDRLEAAYHGKEILDNLRTQVDPTSWATGNLSVGTHTLTSGIYTYTWTVTDAPGYADLRHVSLNITYPPY